MLHPNSPETENNSLINWFEQTVYLVNEENGEKDSIKYLGQNKQKVLLINKCESADFLSEKENLFLLKGMGKKGLLEAINLSLDDVAIINFSKSSIKSFRLLSQKMEFSRMILFGVSPKEINLNIETEKYKVCALNGCKIIFSDSIEMLIGNDSLKKQLWQSLQVMFEDSLKK